jgi:hypothetical protein
MYNLTSDTLWCAPSVGYGEVGGVLSQVQTGIFPFDIILWVTKTIF